MGEFPNKSTQFSSTNQPEKNGRKKKIYTILQEKGFSADDVRLAFGEIAFYTITELDEIINDAEKPVIVIIVAKAMKKAMEDSDWNKIKEIMEHVIGKPNSNIDLKGDIIVTKQVFKIGDQEITF